MCNQITNSTRLPSQTTKLCPLQPLDYILSVITPYPVRLPSSSDNAINIGYNQTIVFYNNKGPRWSCSLCFILTGRTEQNRSAEEVGGGTRGDVNHDPSCWVGK